MRAIRKRKVMAQSKHRDIFDQLKADILGGKYGDGKPLPSAFALMKKFGVARGTVDRAMTALEHEGLIEKRKGSGTYPVKREPITFGVIVPEAECPFYSRVCEGISKFANNSGGGAIIRYYGRMRRMTARQPGKKPSVSGRPGYARSCGCAWIRAWRACSSRGFAMAG